MRNATKLILVLALSVPLGGCKSVLGLSLFPRSTGQPVRLGNIDQFVAPATRAGRTELDAGRPGEAIEKFRKALGEGEPIAPALNGMAVAYARIGRTDLARRYFEEAVAADPLDARYQANLSAFENRLAAASALPSTPAPALAARAPAPVEAYRPGQLQRVSRAEVRIAGAASYAAPVAQGSAMGNPKNLVAIQSDIRTFKPVVRLRLPSPAPTPSRQAIRSAERGFTPVVRIAFTGPASPAAAPGPRRER